MHHESFDNIIITNSDWNVETSFWLQKEAKVNYGLSRSPWLHYQVEREKKITVEICSVKSERNKLRQEKRSAWKQDVLSTIVHKG